MLNGRGAILSITRPQQRELCALELRIERTCTVPSRGKLSFRLLQMLS